MLRLSGKCTKTNIKMKIPIFYFSTMKLKFCCCWLVYICSLTTHTCNSVSSKNGTLGGNSAKVFKKHSSRVLDMEFNFFFFSNGVSSDRLVSL